MLTTKPLLSLLETSHGIELWSTSASLEPSESSFAVKTERGRARLLTTLSSAKTHFDELVRLQRVARAH